MLASTSIACVGWTEWMGNFNFNSLFTLPNSKSNVSNFNSNISVEASIFKQWLVLTPFITK